MPTNSSRNDYVSPLLTNIAQDYSNVAVKNLVAEKILPTVLVEKPDSEYNEYSKNNLVVPESMKLADNGGVPQTVDFSRTKKPINCEDVGLGLRIDRAKMDKAQDPTRYRTKRLKSLMNRIALRRELDTVAWLKERENTKALAGNGSGKDNQWSGQGGDPVELIDSIREEQLVTPNTLVLGRDVYYALRKNPVVLDRLKQNFSGASGAVTVSKEWLATLFEVPNVMIADPFTAGAREVLGSAAPKMQRIWDGLLWLGYVESNMDEESLSFGAHFGVQWPDADELGWIVTYYEDKSIGVRGGEVLKTTGQYKDVAICEDCGYLLTDVLG